MYSEKLWAEKKLLRLKLRREFHLLQNHLNGAPESAAAAAASSELNGNDFADLMKGRTKNLLLLLFYNLKFEWLFCLLI